MVGTGVILGPGATTVLIEGSPASTVLDTVAPHGEPPHTNPVIVTGAATVLAQGKPLTVLGTSIATCGHPATTGSFTVLAT